MLTEAEFLTIVDSIQRAMMIEPFSPSVDDVLALIGQCRVLQRRVARLELENDQLRERVITQTDPLPPR
jgi:hypothetical protein